jgi:hypothetical protein
VRVGDLALPGGVTTDVSPDELVVVAQLSRAALELEAEEAAAEAEEGEAGTEGGEREAGGGASAAPAEEG